MGLFSSKKETPEVGDIVEFEVGYTDGSGQHHTCHEQGTVERTVCDMALVHGPVHGGTYKPDELTIVEKAK